MNPSWPAAVSTPQTEGALTPAPPTPFDQEVNVDSRQANCKPAAAGVHWADTSRTGQRSRSAASATSFVPTDETFGSK